MPMAGAMLLREGAAAVRPPQRDRPAAGAVEHRNADQGKGLVGLLEIEPAALPSLHGVVQGDAPVPLVLNWQGGDVRHRVTAERR